MTIRVGMATERLAGPVTGPREYCRNLCEQLLQDSRVSVIFFSFSSHDHPLYNNTDAERYVLPDSPILAELRLRNLVLDVIHLDAALHRYPFVSALSTPTVATIHGIEPLVLPEYDCSWKVKIQKRYVWPPLARRLDKIITVSESAKEQLLAHYPVTANQVEAIYNGINHKIYYPVEGNKVTRVKKYYDLQGAYILTVNSFSSRKNPETMFRAFDRIAEQIDHSLVVAGPRWDSDPVEQLLANCDHRERIHRIGKVPEKDLPALYTGATCTVSSTIHENFGLPLAESMACGTPVIASGVYAIPEVVGNGGILVDDPFDVDGFASAMETLAFNEDERIQLAEQGRSTVSRYTWENCRDGTIAVYEDLVSN